MHSYNNLVQLLQQIGDTSETVRQNAWKTIHALQQPVPLVTPLDVIQSIQAANWTAAQVHELYFRLFKPYI